MARPESKYWYGLKTNRKPNAYIDPKKALCAGCKNPFSSHSVKDDTCPSCLLRPSGVNQELKSGKPRPEWVRYVIV